MDISQLLSSMSDEDMQKLRETAKSLLGSGSQSAPASEPAGGIDPQLLGSIGKVAGMFNQKDPRCDFLMALKPLMGKERQGRIDDAVQMLRMISVLPGVMQLGGRK